MADRPEVLVLGGGLAGIAAACELKAAGREVLILERAEALGGKAATRSTAFGDFPVGPTSFNGRNPVFWKLLRHLELEDRALKLSPRSGARYLVRGGKLLAIRPNPLSVLTTGALSFGDKVSLARDLLSSHRGAGGADESLDAFLERRFGRALVDHFFGAVMTGIFAGDLKKLSAASCMPALVNAEKEYGSVLRGVLVALRKPEDDSRPGLFTFEGGFSVVGEAAARKVPVRTGVEVTGLTVQPTGVRVTGRSAGGQLQLTAAQVILATEAFAAAPLLEASAPAASSVLASFPYAPLALVQWAERFPGESKLPEGFGYLSAPVEERFALGSLFVSDLLAETPRRFSTFVGGGVHPERAALSDTALARGCARDLESLTGGTFGEIVGVVRWARGVFQPPVGHAQRLGELRETLRGLPISLAGSYLGGAAMKDAIASGFAAAEEVLRRVPGCPPPSAVAQEIRP
ncbi:MAG: protoporphyrinogen oxidase [Myxococcales bacterium]|nr:protoporphyrinogen oxidase [Myxococcales bacterium]